MESIVRVVHLSHRYTTQWAVKDVNFEISSHGVVGLVGSNGAGKSTTMNIICGVLNQTEGDIFIKDINLRENPVEAKKHSHSDQAFYLHSGKYQKSYRILCT